MRPRSSNAIATGSTTSGSLATRSILNPGSVRKVACSSRGASGPGLLRPGGSAANVGSSPSPMTTATTVKRMGRFRFDSWRVGRSQQLADGGLEDRLAFGRGESDGRLVPALLVGPGGRQITGPAVAVAGDANR